MVHPSLLRGKHPTHVVPLLFFSFAPFHSPPLSFSNSLSSSLPLVVRERAREKEYVGANEREREDRAPERGEGRHPSSLRWGPGYPAATFAGSIPAIPTEVQATLSLCLRVLPACLACLPNLPSRAGLQGAPSGFQTRVSALTLSKIVSRLHRER